jgi:MFS family permease
MSRFSDTLETRRARLLSPNLMALGLVSMLAATSSSMIYGLLPAYMTTVMGIGIVAFGFIEGIAELANSLIKLVSGAASDRIGRRKPIVLLGYVLSAVVKLVFPLAATPSAVFVARVGDRMGKGIRDAPRDAFLADLTPAKARGQGFGLRLALAVSGFVIGPMLAIGLMWSSSGDFRLVFWTALIPAWGSILVLLMAVGELPINHGDSQSRLTLRVRDISLLPAHFWWAIAIAGGLSLARFSQAFILLKGREVGIDTIFVPLLLTAMYLVFACAAYPFGILADRFDRRLQLGLGIVVLLVANSALASAGGIWLMVLGAVLWGLQLGITQGLLGAIIADVAPSSLRGTAFGILDVATGIGALIASAGVGAVWAATGSAFAFSISASIAAAVGLMLMFGPYAWLGKA